jgi:hypothetical protein
MACDITWVNAFFGTITIVLWIVFLWIIVGVFIKD